MRALRWLGRGMQLLLTVALSVLLACNLYLIGAQRLFGVEHPTAFGFTTAVVASGSMSPALEVNDLILIRTQDSYEPGDIITFQSGNSLVTHRVVKETEAGFVTRGDANNTADLEPVPLDDVVGKVVWQIPGAGAVLGYLRAPMGLMCLVLLGVLLLSGLPRKPRAREEDGNEF